MKLWILKVATAWDPWYDKADGFVVRAETEESARKWASNNHGDEGAEAWLDDGLTICEELTAEGDPGVILRDFNAA